MNVDTRLSFDEILAMKQRTRNSSNNSNSSMVDATITKAPMTAFAPSKIVVISDHADHLQRQNGRRTPSRSYSDDGMTRSFTTATEEESVQDSSVGTFCNVEVPGPSATTFQHRTRGAKAGQHVNVNNDDDDDYNMGSYGNDSDYDGSDDDGEDSDDNSSESDASSSYPSSDSSSSGEWDSDLEEMESWMLKNDDPIIRNGQFQMETVGITEHLRHTSKSGSGLRRSGSFQSLPSMNGLKKQQARQQRQQQASRKPAKITSTNNVTGTKSNTKQLNYVSGNESDDWSRASEHTSRSETFLRKIRKGTSTAPYNSKAMQTQNCNPKLPSAMAGDSENASYVSEFNKYAHIQPEEFLTEYVKAYGYSALDELKPNLSKFNAGNRKGSRMKKPVQHIDITSPSYPQAAKAARSNDLLTIQRLHTTGCDLHNCSNKFGESIVHIACRRGNYAILRYLAKIVKVNLRLQDDYGRTPLHDAAWTETPNFEAVALLLRYCPELLFVRDKRGHLAVSYIPHAARPHWILFFMSRPDLIEACMDRA